MSACSGRRVSKIISLVVEMLGKDIGWKTFLFTVEYD